MLEKIVADMPRITPKQIRKHILSVNMGLKIADDECRVLAENGYRKVPSLDDFKEKVINSAQFLDGYTVKALAGGLHRWLLEGK